MNMEDNNELYCVGGVGNLRHRPKGEDQYTLKGFIKFDLDRFGGIVYGG